MIRYEGLALQSLEADAIRRTVLIHGLPPFTTKSQIDHNLNYLLQQAQLTDNDIQTTSNHVKHLHERLLENYFSAGIHLKSIFFQTFKQKKRWYHSNEHEDMPLRIERDVPMLERIERAPPAWRNRFSHQATTPGYGRVPPMRL